MGGNIVYRGEPTYPLAGWELVWSDEFDGSVLDTDKWLNPTNDNSGASSNTVCNFLSSMAYLDGNSNLVIKADRGVSGGFGPNQYASGQISAKTFSHTYGRREWCFQLPAGGAGIWPALWAYDIVGGNWPPEQDDLEAMSDMSVWHTTYHWDATSGYDLQDFTPPNLATGFHILAVEWEPGVMRWYMDGVLYRTSTGANIASTPMSPIIDLYLGGSWAGDPSGTTFPQYMLVDYVRIYRRPS